MDTERDDRILPTTRILAAVVIGILSLAWFVLYLHPDQTDRRFAWTIASRMTAMLMGAGYGSAIVFYAGVLAGRRWHRVALGFIPTTVFTWMLLATTFLHWAKFRHGSLPFELWLWIYLATPVLVPAVWLVNRGRDPRRHETRDASIEGPMRWGVIGAGVPLVAVAALLFVRPSAVIGSWPWPLTPLTTRAIAAFVALPGVGWLAIAADRRWSAARLLVATLGVGIVLLLVAVARAWSEFDHSNPLAYVYVAGLAGTLVGLVGLFVAEERGSRASAQKPSTAPSVRGSVPPA